MKFYELTYLISPDLSTEELKVFSQKISNLIQEEGGSLERAGDPVKRRLGYQIANRDGAYLTVLDFQLEPNQLISLEKKLKQDPQILRYTIFTKTPAKKTLVQGKKPPIQKPSRKIEKPKPKVELKEIEKKLEEILGE